MDVKKLKELREKTGVSFSMCKKALEESNNDIAKAEKLLSEWGAEKAAKKADRETQQGGIFSYVHHSSKIGTMIELRSETDFVSGNEEFKKLGHEMAMQLAFSKVQSVEDFLKESDELRKAQIMDVWYKALFRFTEEEIYNSVNKGLNLVGEDVVYGEGFSEKTVLEKVENFCKARKASQQIQTTIEEIKKLIGACEELANDHKLTFNLNICDTDFDYKQTNSGGYWYSSSRNC